MCQYKMRYLTEPRDSIFVKSFKFFPFAKTMFKNIGQTTTKILSAHCSQKLFDNAKQSVCFYLPAFKRTIQKTTEETSDVNGNW